MHRKTTKIPSSRDGISSAPEGIRTPNLLIRSRRSAFHGRPETSTDQALTPKPRWWDPAASTDVHRLGCQVGCHRTTTPSQRNCRAEHAATSSAASPARQACLTRAIGRSGDVAINEPQRSGRERHSPEPPGTCTASETIDHARSRRAGFTDAASSRPRCCRVRREVRCREARTVPGRRRDRSWWRGRRIRCQRLRRSLGSSTATPAALP